MGMIINPYLVQPSGPSYDADAQAFFTAAGITDTTQKSAVNQLVLDLKSYSIWTKMKALYPMVGGTATTHKYNLKDPQDTDAAYRLVFNGGWTHSSTGADPNGTNAYADTKLKASTNLSTSSSHMSQYIRTQSEEDVLMADGTLACFLQLAGGQLYGSMATTSYSNTTQTNNVAFYMINRPSSTNQKLIRNSTILLNDSKTSSSFTSSQNIILSAYTTTSAFDTAEIAFSSIGDGLTDTEASNFYTAIQAFQTTLGRQI